MTEKETLSKATTDWVAIGVVKCAPCSTHLVVQPQRFLIQHFCICLLRFSTSDFDDEFVDLLVCRWQLTLRTAQKQVRRRGVHSLCVDTTRPPREQEQQQEQ